MASKYDRCNHIFSLGIDHFWRKKLIGALHPYPHQQVLDLCCGTGDVVFSFLKNSPVQSITGLDLSQSMIDLARKKQTRYRGRSWMQKKNTFWKVTNAVQTGLDSNGFDRFKPVWIRTVLTLLPVHLVFAISQIGQPP
jgi:ubiquinone/menaquinone biosynthesis C-methylase UbiE